MARLLRIATSRTRLSPFKIFSSSRMQPYQTLSFKDGVFGALIVRQASNKNSHASQYDVDSSEHVIVLNDWSSKKSWSSQLAAYFYSGEHDASSNSIDSILINGRGQSPSKNLLIPLAEFSVRKDAKYRFRVINAGSSHCPFQFSIDGHNLTVIAIDGQPIDPFEVESFISNSGSFETSIPFLDPD